MHIQIIVELVDFLMNEIEIENSSFENQFVDLPHLADEGVIGLEFVLLFDSDAVK